MRSCRWPLLVLAGILAPLSALAQEPAVAVLEDMEGDVAARWQDLEGTAALTLEPDDQITKEGKQSGRWPLDSAARQIVLSPPDMPHDWAAYGALELWVHAEKATGALFAIVLGSENPATAGEDHFRCLIPVDWEGWRFLLLEPRSFSPGRDPVGWGQIDSLRLSAAGWSDLRSVPGTVLRFDALRLVRPAPDPDRRLLFDPDTDWCAWWPLSYATDPVRTGRYVSEWLPRGERATVLNHSVPRDWSGLTHLNLWLHCTGAAGATLTVTAASDDPQAAASGAYALDLPLAEDGWRLLSMPLASFRARGEPAGWQTITALRLTFQPAAQAPPEVRLCLDDIWLSAREETEETWARGRDAPADGLPPTAGGDVAQLLREALEAKRAGNAELAFTRYVAVLLREPGNVDAHWGLAWVLAGKGEKEAAVEHFRKVVEMAKDPQRVKEAKDALGRLQ